MAQSEGPTPDTTPRGGKEGKDGMTERAGLKGMQSHTVIQGSRNDEGQGRKKEHLTNVEEKASLPSS